MMIRAGDVLLYSGTGFFSKLIKVKTWSAISHVEVSIGNGYSVASRDGQGVGLYPHRATELVAILRPKGPFDVTAAMRWFQTVDGQGYDWLGLMAFYWAKWQGKENGKMFCSEFAVRFLRAGGVEPFTPETDADAVAPGEFLKSGALLRVDRAAAA